MIYATYLNKNNRKKVNKSSDILVYQVHVYVLIRVQVLWDNINRLYNVVFLTLHESGVIEGDG